jgi:dipeptidyl-peptidase-4
VQDRAQTWLDFCTVAPGGEVKRLFRETTKAWVDDPGAPVFLKDGSFLFTSARTGWLHLYHYDADGKLKRAVTSGEWELTTGAFQPHPVERVDEKNGWVYFTAKKDSPIASNLYRVKLDGSGLERLTSGPGDHRVSVSPTANLFIDTWSSHADPPKVRLCKADGTAARTLDTNPVYAREEYLVGTYELVHVPTPDGFELDGSLLKPPGFDPKRHYPVWVMTYAGPHMPTVHDNWGGGRLQDEMIAQLGFVVFRIDPRSATDKGQRSTWTAYRKLGVQELKDLETAVKWLTGHEWADPARVGLSGSSYGGFMTAFALTHSKLFAAGVATAAVTDWRNYDTIYTERYMNTPQENPDGYDASSVVKAARNLHGKLLIVHGVMDDNVHVQNALQLVDALQRADKDFEVMIYPRARHGGFTPRHYQRLVIDFMTRALRPEK